MADFFPPGFWRAAVWLAMAVFSVLGVDMLFGSRLMLFMSQTMNKKIHIDQMVVSALAAFKDKSDREFDTERSLLYGFGRVVVSGILFVSVFLMFSLLLPRLS
jgi:hypothetical protein